MARIGPTPLELFQVGLGIGRDIGGSIAKGIEGRRSKEQSQILGKAYNSLVDSPDLDTGLDSAMGILRDSGHEDLIPKLFETGAGKQAIAIQTKRAEARASADLAPLTAAVVNQDYSDSNIPAHVKNLTGFIPGADPESIEISPIDPQGGFTYKATAYGKKVNGRSSVPQLVLSTDSIFSGKGYADMLINQYKTGVRSKANIAEMEKEAELEGGLAQQKASLADAVDAKRQARRVGSEAAISSARTADQISLAQAKPRATPSLQKITAEDGTVVAWNPQTNETSPIMSGDQGLAGLQQTNPLIARSGEAQAPIRTQTTQPRAAEEGIDVPGFGKMDPKNFEAARRMHQAAIDAGKYDGSLAQYIRDYYGEQPQQGLNSTPPPIVPDDMSEALRRSPTKLNALGAAVAGAPMIQRNKRTGEMRRVYPDGRIEVIQ